MSRDDWHVTVVVPTYNLQRYVAETIASIYAQTYTEWDLLVVDDGSKDGTAEAARAAIADERGQVLQRPNGGASAARNAGIRAARGPLVALCDGDDVWSPEKLELQVKALRERPEIRTVSSQWIEWHPGEEGVYPDPLQGMRAANGNGTAASTDITYERLMEEAGICTSAAVFYKEVADEVGGFDETLPCGEDYDFWLKMTRHSPIHRLERPLAAYRKHAASLTRMQALQLNYRAVAVDYAIQRWGWLDPQGREISKSAVRRGLARSWQDFADASLNIGNSAGARTAVLQALRCDPLAVRSWKIAVKAAFGAFRN